MMRILTRLLMAVVLLCMATLAQAELLVVNSPGDGYLNLRTGPGDRFAIIMRMDHGTQVETLEGAGNWVRVQHESGAVGWAFGKYMVRPASASVRLYVAPTSDGFLNLRTGPGTGFAIITSMDTGSWVEVLERKGNWVRVFHEYGDVGWAYLPYLTR